jgi:hypothetical protein
MESIFTTLALTVMSGSDLGLAMVRALLEHIWLGGLLLGLCLLMSWLKLPHTLLFALVLFLLVSITVLIAAG